MNQGSSFFLGSIDTPYGRRRVGTGKKEIRKQLENRLEEKEESGNIDQREKDLVRGKRKRLPSIDRLRQELVYQLRESLRSSQEKMNSPELSLAERHHWTQVHTYTAQVFNTVLRDLQMKDWENRLKFIEEGDHERRTLPTS